MAKICIAITKAYLAICECQTLRVNRLRSLAPVLGPRHRDRALDQLEWVHRLLSTTTVHIPTFSQRKNLKMPSVTASLGFSAIGNNCITAGPTLLQHRVTIFLRTLTSFVLHLEPCVHLLAVKPLFSCNRPKRFRRTACTVS